MIRHLAAAALAATTLVLLPAAASAAPPKYTAAPVPSALKKAPVPYASLTLTVTPGEVARRTSPGVTLTCRPTGGTHPTPAEACKALEKTNGDVFAVPPRKGVLCTADYRPVTASVTGNWGRRPISDSRTFGNACQLGIATGVFFTPPK
jgi:hypothetical protein